VRVLGVLVVFLAVSVSAVQCLLSPPRVRVNGLKRECIGDESRVNKQLATSSVHAGRRVGCFIVGTLPAKHRPATFCTGSRLYACRSIYSTARKQDSDIHVSMSRKDNYRADGVRIQHDPYAKGMAEKYGRPGETDAEGFDPYAGHVALIWFQSDPAAHGPTCHVPTRRAVCSTCHVPTRRAVCSTTLTGVQCTQTQWDLEFTAARCSEMKWARSSLAANSRSSGCFFSSGERLRAHVDTRVLCFVRCALQNHNPEPGPVYTGEGYTDISKALSKVSLCCRPAYLRAHYPSPASCRCNCTATSLAVRQHFLPWLLEQ
jgi:hypothetical protein